MYRIKTLWLTTRRLFPGFLAAIFFVAVTSQVLPGVASATTQLVARSILMSSSSPGATAVTYTVTFTPQADTPTANPDVIIDFCNISTDPIVGDTCSGTAGTDVPNLTSVAATGWTVNAFDASHGVRLTGTHTFASGTPVVITLTGITNQSNVGGANLGGFYARILTYANGGSGSITNTAAGAGAYVDYGGIALSVAANIVITSKVFETLTFCIFTGASCVAGSAPSLILGDSTSQALSVGSAYVNNNAQYTLSTNAGSGVNVVMRGNTLCRPGGTCTTGANAFTISAIGVTPAVAAAPGTVEQFGMCVDKNASAAVTVATQYADTINSCHTGLTTGTYSGSSKFGFDDSSTVTTGTASTTGSQILSSAGAVPSYTGTFAFVANISPTTEAGVYATSLNLVATGTF